MKKIVKFNLSYKDLDLLVEALSMLLDDWAEEDGPYAAQGHPHKKGIKLLRTRLIKAADKEIRRLKI